jgi:hypothetical protein
LFSPFYHYIFGLTVITVMGFIPFLAAGLRISDNMVTVNAVSV